MRTRLFFAVASCAVFLSGCSSRPVIATADKTPLSGLALRGMVHGGQQPIVGAHVYLYAAGATGYGIASSSLLASTGSNTSLDTNGNYYVTTGSDGTFSISGDYTCPSSASQVYLYSVGGNPGAGANSAAGLLAALGTCPASGTLSTALFVSVNEVSTIATAYAIASYSVDATHVSSPGSILALAGIANAFASAANLESLASGIALVTTPGGNGTVPESEIDTLANILAACINSTGPSSTACTTLVANAMQGATAPTDTATAAINIAHNPGANIANLYGLQTGTPPFQPMLTSQPNDFTVAVTYTGGGLNGIQGIAIDASGNVWTANAGNSSLSEFSPGGAGISSPAGFIGGGLANPVSIAIDGSGNAWASNQGNNSLSEFSSAGIAVSTIAGYTGDGLTAPQGIAIDAQGFVWVANPSANSISKFTSAGVANGGSSPYMGGGLNGSGVLAIDSTSDVWTNNAGASSLSEFNSSGTAISSASGYTGGNLNAPMSVAIDGAGDIWAVNQSTNVISEFDGSGNQISAPGFTGGGLNAPLGLAIDGNGTLWLANTTGNSISEFAATGAAVTGASGFLGGLTGPAALAVDGSGNLWVSNTNNSITEFIGIATPLVTPVVANLMSPYGLQTVNEP